MSWGYADFGGDRSSVQDQLKNVQQIQTTGKAFAAVLCDGSVVTWGHATTGGDAMAVQGQLKNATKTCRDLDVAAEVYRLTVEERDRGWLTGPFTLQDVPATAVVTCRFGVKQGMTTSSSEAVAKIRPIDDFTESLAN